MNLQKIIDELPTLFVGTFLDNGIDKPLNVVKEIYSITKYNKVFEIGTHVGHSSLLFLAESNADVISVDIHGEWVSEDKLKNVELTLNKFFPNRYKQIIHTSQDHDFFINQNDIDLSNIDLIHVDGLHVYDACKNDIDLGKKLKCKYFLIDDYQHDDMIRAVKDTNLIPIKIWKSVHSNVCDIGLFKYVY